MGLFDKLFKRPARVTGGAIDGAAWETLTAYRPAFTSWDGRLYENELIRASVDALARNTQKLQVTFNGSAKQRLRRELRVAPNEWQTWSQFLYRLRTIYEMQCTAVIVPVFDDFGEISGYFPVLFSRCEIVQYNGEPYLKYRFDNGKVAAVEFSLCGILTKYQYQDDIFGTGNTALKQTMELISMQSQGISEGVKNGATFRFMARMNNFLKPDDLANERRRFNRENLQDESGGILLFPNTYSDIKQVDQKPFIVDHEQMEMIQQNVFSYFGVNMDILQNKCFGDAWNAFYEGAIETFAIQLSDVMTRMTFSAAEIARGNSIFVTSNRLQYMSNADKLNVTAQLLDRGMLNRDEARAIWNLPPLPDGQGQSYIIRGEYKNADDQVNGDDSNANSGGTGDPAGNSNAGPAGSQDNGEDQSKEDNV